jgi:hypothetical protein
VPEPNDLDDLLAEIDRGPGIVEWPNGSASEVRAGFTGNDDGRRYMVDDETGAFVLIEDDDSEGGMAD